MQKTSLRYGLAVSLLIAGCDPTPPKVAPAAGATSTVVPRTSLAWENIAPGDRPVAIEGAKFYRVAEVARLKAGDLVCIEGTVKSTGSIMGGDFVSLASDAVDKSVQCFGYHEWEQIARGSNIVIRGKVHSSWTLMEANLVTQQEIDAALKAEAESKVKRSTESRDPVFPQDIKRD